MTCGLFFLVLIPDRVLHFHQLICITNIFVSHLAPGKLFSVLWVNLPHAVVDGIMSNLTIKDYVTLQVNYFTHSI